MRLLVRLPNWLGDLLMARPLLHALRASFPDARILALGGSASRLLDRERIWNEWRAWDEARAPWPRERFDAALVLPPSFSSAWRLRSVAVARRIGFRGEARSWLLSDPVSRPPRGEMHLSEEYLALGARLGVRRTPVPALTSLEEETAQASSRLEALGSRTGPIVVLAPGAAYGPAKRWPPERWSRLGSAFRARGESVLVCGAAEDAAVAQAVADGIGSGAHALAGRTSLGEQLALCARANVTVSNDSGLAHLAAAAGAPTVVVFGSTSSAWTAPLGPRVEVVQRAPVCSPCFQRTCSIGTVCLTGIGVEDVQRACARAAA